MLKHHLTISAADFYCASGSPLPDEKVAVNPFRPPSDVGVVVDPSLFTGNNNNKHNKNSITHSWLLTLP